MSDTFGSALWCLDHLLDCAAHGCAGVHLEADVTAAACSRPQAFSAESKDGTTLAGTAVSPPTAIGRLRRPRISPSKDSQLTVTIPHASAVIVRLQP